VFYQPAPPIEIRAGGLRPPVDLRRQVIVLENHALSETRPVPAGGRAAQEIPFPYGLPRSETSGGGSQGGGCASRTEFIRRRITNSAICVRLLDKTFASSFVDFYPHPGLPPKLATLVFRGGSHLARRDVLLTRMASP